MTTFAIGDYHGKSIQRFLDQETPGKGDRILSTGDFDQVDVIHELLELQKNKGLEVVSVAGNHDHAMLNRRRIRSGSIQTQGKTYKQMVKELEADREAREYLEKLVENPVREFQIGDLQGVLVHSALDGYLQNQDMSDEARQFWYRLWDEEDFNANFDIMREKNYDLMIRGHDHWREHVFRPKEDSSASFHDPEPGAKYNLDQDYRHIITHGPWDKGNYLIIDEEDTTVEFAQI